MDMIGHSLATAGGRLLAVDPQICEIMHREERDLVGVTFHSLTHPDDLDRNVAALMALRVKDGPLSLKKRYVRPDGSTIWSSVKVSRLHANDGSKLVGTIHVISPQNLEHNPESLWRSARRVTALIERRRAALTDDLFSDYPWLILLQIYIAEAEGRKADTPGVADDARIRHALAARWLGVLEGRGLVERPKSTDHAVQLTAKGMTTMERLLQSGIDY